MHKNTDCTIDTFFMFKVLRDLVPLNRLICSKDYDKTIKYLNEILPFRTIQIPAEEEYNGWVIPPKWDVLEAKIIKNGTVIYDGLHHPLAVIALSTSFRGKVSLQDLKRHLYFDHRYDDSLTFHFRQQFRSWDRAWGFCVPKKFYDNLEEGDYEIIIETRESPGILKILEYTKKGENNESIAFCVNLDHPGVANDGMSGVVVGIELMRQLSKIKTKYTYKLVLAPGIIGSEYYLGKMNQTDRKRIIECVCLWMLGSSTALALQASRGERSNIENILAGVMASESILFRHGDFQSIIINDEYIWEAYGIPACSLSRFPYPEYHSSRDNLSIMKEESLGEAVAILKKTIEDFESSHLVIKRFSGTICLSNPCYDLYVDPGQIAFGDNFGKEIHNLRRLQDYIPSIRNPVTVRSLSNTFNLKEQAVLDYLFKWSSKGLIELK